VAPAGLQRDPSCTGCI